MAGVGKVSVGGFGKFANLWAKILEVRGYFMLGSVNLVNMRIDRVN